MVVQAVPQLFGLFLLPFFFRLRNGCRQATFGNCQVFVPNTNDSFRQRVRFRPIPFFPITISGNRPTSFNVLGGLSIS